MRNDYDKLCFQLFNDLINFAIFLSGAHSIQFPEKVCEFGLDLLIVYPIHICQTIVFNASMISPKQMPSIIMTSNDG